MAKRKQRKDKGNTVKVKVELIKYGLEVDEETAYILINDYLKEKDITELYVLILEELQNKGFLPRTVNLKEILSKTQEQMKM